MSTDDLRAQIRRERAVQVRDMSIEPNRDYPELRDLLISLSPNTTQSVALNRNELRNLIRVCEQELISRDTLAETITVRLLNQPFPADARTAVGQVLDALDDVLSDAARPATWGTDSFDDYPDTERGDI